MSLIRGSGRAALSLTAGVSLLGMTLGACSAPSPESLSHTDSPIIGGKLDTTHKAVVSLLKQVQGGYFPSCSGTLLTQNLVLTAHHCVAALDSQDGASVECGETEFQQPESAQTMLISVEANVGQEGLDPYRVAKVWVPETGSAVCGKDIALLLLSGAGIPANVAQPIEPGFAGEVKPEAVFAAIGYGLQDPNDDRGETAGHRMGVSDAQVFCAGQACGTPMVTEGEWIAESPVCSGDSGGPALDQNGRVVGVTSRGDQECTIGIYSSVYAWRDFIKKGVFDAAEAGHYTPPTWAGEPPDGFDPGIGGGSSGGATSAGGSSAGGTPGSGGSLTIAGSPTVIAGMNSGGGANMSPVVDPLGLACTGTCPGAYKCWAESGQPPGICVPACSAAAPTCPTNFTCSPELQACVKSSALGGGDSRDSSGCSVTAPAPATGRPRSTWLAGLALLAAVALRRSKRRA